MVRENFHFCNETQASTAAVGTRIVATVYNENEIVYTKMSKSKEELNAIKEDVETVSKKLQELTEEELERVTGGLAPFPGSPLRPTSS